uniref:FRIGIDA-like protein n=1 Tax=Strongyloides venezuelensis TaxID=75913 RepID=A0A0K0FDV2_STRVS
MPSIVDAFLSSISSASRCYKDVETMYAETRKYSELNELWKVFKDIIRYKNKEVRRLIVERLVEKDVEKKRSLSTPCAITIVQRQINAALGELGDFIVFNLGYFFICDEEQDLSKHAEKVSKCIKDVLIYNSVSRQKLHQIDNCDIAFNFS